MSTVFCRQGQRECRLFHRRRFSRAFGNPFPTRSIEPDAVGIGEAVPQVGFREMCEK